MNISILMIITFSLLILYVVLRRISHDEVILKKGKNFSVKEKKEILKVLDKMEEYYQTGNGSGFSIGMCNNLRTEMDNELYVKLFNLYHNPWYYQERGLHLKSNFKIRGYWWNPIDLYSRFKATLILKDAVIND